MAVESTLPLFYWPEWLDAVCGQEAWGVAMAWNGNDDSTRVVWPYQVRQKFGQSLLLPPALTPYLGPWVQPNAGGTTKTLLTECLSQIPQSAYALATTYPGRNEGFLELYWKQWRHIKRVTYTIPASTTVEQAWAAVDSSVRNKVRKAQKNFTLEFSHDFEALWKTQVATFAAQQMKVPYSKSWLYQLFETIHRLQCGRLALARDSKGHVAGTQLTVWDAHYGYNLLLSSYPHYRQDGVVQWLLWDSLERILATERSYDFEGSILPAIAPVFSAFGAREQEYHLLYKPGNRFWATVWELLGKSVK